MYAGLQQSIWFQNLFGNYILLAPISNAHEVCLGLQNWSQSLRKQKVRNWIIIVVVVVVGTKKLLKKKTWVLLLKVHSAFVKHVQSFTSNSSTTKKGLLQCRVRLLTGSCTVGLSGGPGIYSQPRNNKQRLYQLIQTYSQNIWWVTATFSSSPRPHQVTILQSFNWRHQCSRGSLTSANNWLSQLSVCATKDSNNLLLWSIDNMLAIWRKDSF